VPTPFPAGAVAGIRVLSRSEAQKVVDRAPPQQQGQSSFPAPKKSEADSILASAVTMERRGDLDGAIYLLKRGISQLPHPGPLYNKLALILIHQRRDFRQAEELLHKALELEPENEVYEKNLYKVVTLAALQQQGDP
jgi:Flp pilus assembly protein TadD